MLLEGKRIVVTGGSGGIGSPLVEMLFAEGAELWVIGRRGRTSHVVADLSSEEGLATATEAVSDISPDILVCLAGSQYFGSFLDQEPDAIQRSYRVNLQAPSLLARAALPGMVRRRSGHVLFAGSVFGAVPFAHFAAYSSAKAGLSALTWALRREFSGSGVAFTCAMPRAVRTGMATESIRRFAKASGFKFDEPEAVARRLLKLIVEGRGEIRPGFPETLMMRINSIAPGLASRLLASGDRKAAKILSTTPRSFDR